jgi:phosphatidylserine decarboxylase
VFRLAASAKMKNYPHPILAREGWPFIALSLVLALLSLYFGGASLLFWLIFLFCVQFFRDPARRVPEGAKNVLSPADGRIIVVEEAEDPYLKKRALKISVFMNVFNVHSNRSPIACVVRQKWHDPGRFLNAAFDKASLENERCALHLETVDGRDITCIQIAGLIARRILNYAEKGATLAPGERYGFIRFGSRVDLYLPPDTRARVVIGEKVRATSTVLAELA